MTTERIVKKITLGLIAASSLFLAPLASAAPVSQWDFTANMQWVLNGENAPTFSSGSGALEDDNPNRLSWGGLMMSSPPFLSYNPAINPNRSGVGITTPNANGTVTTDGPLALTNAITHYNNSIDAAYATLTSATLSTSLTLSPFGSGIALDPLTALIGIQFYESPNTSNIADCGFASVTACDDLFIITFGALNTSFTYDGYEYFVSVIETSNQLNPLSPEACAAAGAAAGCIGFQTPEDLFTLAQFGILITSEPVTIGVPEPGLLALLGIGLVGLAWSRRRAV